MSKQINLVINGKGGVGKSFFAVNFVQYLKDRGHVHRAIDSDHENSTLKRFHPESDFIDLEHRREIDRMFTAAENCDLLVIDCRAASTDLFIDFFDEVGLAEVLRTLDARLTVICPVNHEADSVEQLRILSDALGNGCRWVIVKNEAHSDTFKIYESSKTRRPLLDVQHAREAAMPRLHDWLVAALNEHNVPITTALQRRLQPARPAAAEALANWLLHAARNRRRLAHAMHIGAREMSADDPLAGAVSDWQRKHRIADGDPMIAALDLVRIYLLNARKVDDAPDAEPPSFEDFRATVELLDRRSKKFIHQAADIVADLRRFGQSVERLNQSRFLTQLVLVVLGVVVGGLSARWL